MRKLTMALMVGSTLALAAPAFAADVVEEQVYDWSGLYAGVFAGVGFTSSDWDGKDTNIGLDPIDIDTSLNDSALLLGGLVGVNFQHDNLVFGLEGDIAWLHSDKDKHLDGAEGLDLESKIDWLGSVRGRLGWADDRTLFYATGGLAFADAEHTWDDGGDYPQSDLPAKSVHLDFGWVAGLGIEHAWTDNVLFRIEGLYYDLGSEHGRVSSQYENDTFDVDQEIWVGRIGISYKFN